MRQGFKLFKSQIQPSICNTFQLRKSICKRSWVLCLRSLSWGWAPFPLLALFDRPCWIDDQQLGLVPGGNMGTVKLPMHLPYNWNNKHPQMLEFWFIAVCGNCIRNKGTCHILLSCWSVGHYGPINSGSVTLVCAMEVILRMYHGYPFLTTRIDWRGNLQESPSNGRSPGFL